MDASLPTLLVPGLTSTPRLYEPQIPALWQFGPVMVADHRRDDSIAAIARRILAAASDGRHLVTEFISELNSEVSQAADALHGNQIPWKRTAVP